MKTTNTEKRTIMVEEVIRDLTDIIANDDRLSMLAEPSRAGCRKDAAEKIAALLEMGGQWGEYPAELSHEQWESIQHGADLCAALDHNTVERLCGF